MFNFWFQTMKSLTLSYCACLSTALGLFVGFFCPPNLAAVYCHWGEAATLCSDHAVTWAHIVHSAAACLGAQGSGCALLAWRRQA